MTAPFIVPPIFRLFDNSGLPAAGYLLYTYAAGTTTPKTTYSDANATVPNSNPVVLDSTGSAIVRAGVGAYNLVAKDPTGTTTIWSADQYIFPVYTQADIIALLGADPIKRQTAEELAAGVTPVNYAYPPGDIRRYGGLADAATTLGTSGTDNSAAIASALTIGIPVYIPAGRWGFKNIIIPGGSTFTGDGVEKTNLISLSGATGTVVADNGSSAKTIWKGMSIFCNGPSSGNNTGYTAGVVLGKSTAYGTEGYIDQIEVRDLPSSIAAGFPGIDITGNVGEFGALYALNTGGVQILGSANMVQYIESTGSQGWLLASGQGACCNLQDGTVVGLHIEAPGSFITGGSTLAGGTNTFNFSGSATVPLVLGGGAGSPGGNVSVLNPSFSLPGNAHSITYTYDHLVELGVGAGTWSLTNLKLYYGGSPGSHSAITGGCFKDASGNYFGGTSPTTTGTHAPENNYSSGLFSAGQAFAAKQQQLSNFSILIANNTGTIQHKITAAGQTGVVGSWITSIAGDSLTYANTPNVGSGTDFTNGAGINGSSTYQLVVNSGNEIAADTVLLANISMNGTGTAYTVRPTLVTLNVNGVTRTWLAFDLHAITATSPTVAWATALGTATWFIEVTFLGFVK